MSYQRSLLAVSAFLIGAILFPPRQVSRADSRSLLQRSDEIIVGSVRETEDVELRTWPNGPFLWWADLEPGRYCLIRLKTVFRVSSQTVSVAQAKTVYVRLPEHLSTCGSLNGVSSSENVLFFLRKAGHDHALASDLASSIIEIGNIPEEIQWAIKDSDNVSDRLACVLLSRIVALYGSSATTLALAEGNRIRAMLGWKSYLSGLSVLYQSSDPQSRVQAVKQCISHGMCLTQVSQISFSQLDDVSVLSIFLEKEYRRHFVDDTLVMLSKENRMELEKSMAFLSPQDTLTWFACFSDKRLAARARLLLLNTYNVNNIETLCVPCE